MSTILMNLLSFIVKRLIDAKLFEIIKALVESQVSTELTGDQKKQAVKDSLTNLQGNLKSEFEQTKGSLVNFAIEAAVLLIKR